MVDKVDAQFIEFKGDNNTKRIVNEKPLLDNDTEMALLESTKNYNKMVNNMFDVCSKICIKKFTESNFNTHELICVENCQKKFFASYSIGHGLLSTIFNQIDKTDIFTNPSDVNLIQNTIDSIKKI